MIVDIDGVLVLAHSEKEDAATGGGVRDGAWVAELAGDVLKGWPKGMRLIERKERPHPGAQLRITDAHGMRLICFVTNTADIPIAILELRHRQRACAEDRIRAARDAGLRNPAAARLTSLGTRPSGELVLAASPVPAPVDSTPEADGQDQQEAANSEYGQVG